MNKLNSQPCYGKHFGRLSAGLFLGGFLANIAVAQPQYSVTEIKPLPGMTTSAANALNDRGWVVGQCSSTADRVGFIWNNGTIVSTGKLPKGIESIATAINSAGVVVGDGDTGDYRPQSWVTSTRGLINIFPNNGGNTHAIGINDSGVICGYYTKSLSGWVSSWTPAIWTVDPKDPRKYRTTVLPILVGPDPTFKGTTAIPAAFNQSGQAAGYANNEVIGQHACFWNNDSAHSIVDLGTFPGDWSSLAYGMNDLGQVVGTSHPPSSSRPVLWDNDPAHTVYELPPLPGDDAGSAAAINNSGQVIGLSYASVPGTWDHGPERFVIWIDGQPFDLDTLLEPVSGAGWTLSTLAGINNLGQVVGTGVHNGETRAFLLTPIYNPARVQNFPPQ